MTMMWSAVGLLSLACMAYAVTCWVEYRQELKVFKEGKYGTIK